MILSQRATETEAKTFFAELNVKHRIRRFCLNEACFPTSSEAWLEEGYRAEKYDLDDEDWGVCVPILIISSSSEKTFHLFMCFLKLFKKMVKVSLERSCDGDHKRLNFSISNIDPIPLRSLLWDYENLFVGDGCAGIAVLSRKSGFTVILNEHKYLIIYNWILFKKSVLAILENNEIQRKQNIQVVVEMKHCHTSSKSFQGKFRELKLALKKMGV